MRIITIKDFKANQSCYIVTMYTGRRKDSHPDGRKSKL